VSAGDATARRDRVLARARAEPNALVCIVGPTASGKTDLAVDVCEALGGAVISADSVQIYRGFDIGSGKPTADQLARAPHRLVSTHDALTPIDAPTWAKLAETEIEAIRRAGKIPIVCGGTFFWIRALVLGLVAAPAASPEIRAKHRELVEREGRGALHAELARVDPASAARLHPNDVIRVSRALEVQELSGKTMSEWQDSHGFRTRRFDAAMFAVRHDAETLTARITARVEAWLTGGFLEEVAGLIERGYGEARAMGSVGYAEVRAHLAGHLTREELPGAIVRSTRVFARRQRTWLNHSDVEWLA
jgi:tRNA dimethylallyltransferase